MKNLLLLAALYVLPLASTAQMFYSVASPNGLIRAQIVTDPDLRWHLTYRGASLWELQPIALNIEAKGNLGQNARVIRKEERREKQTLRPVIAQKGAEISEQYNELTLYFDGDWGVTFRAYDEGVAYRFFTQFKKTNAVTVMGETYSIPLSKTQTVFFPEEEGFYSHNERLYKFYAAADLGEAKLASLPTLLGWPDGTKVLLTETDLQDYPGLWLRGTQHHDLQGVFPAYPKNTQQSSDRDIKITDRESFLAHTAGQRNYPWRLFLVAGRDADLLTNQLPWLLAEPSRLNETAWIRPGKVAWDWWNNLNISGVDFPAGVNTATYKHFVDFAAENGLEYIILDEGWSDPGNLLAINPDLNMDELAAYARQKNVGLILWTTWVSIDKQFDALLPDLKKWSIKGLKVDFMQRDDQPAVRFYWKMAEKAAANHLLLDFHGAHKPAGLQRTWPNVLSFEGVYGLEQSKWDKDKRIDPQHNVTLPFIRQVAGPMDYTPGAMLNYQRDDWSPSFNRPASLGTRCHELAKYVVFESPLQMLADNPTNYRKEPECLRFLANVPAVWNKSVALDGQVGDFVAIARQAANGLWYIGAMTDWEARRLFLNMSFLPPGNYELELYEDGINARRNAQDYRRTVKQITSNDVLKVDLAPGGGWVGILRKL